MPNSQVIQTLVELRKRAGLTQEQTAQILGIGRRTVTDWESGKATPHKSRADSFLKYLLDDLGLADDLSRFYHIWEIVCIDQWKWEPLSPFQQWILKALERPKSPLLDVPSVPPHLRTYSLIGRERLINQLRPKLLNNIAISLTGIPGIGKTALAVAISEDNHVLEHFEDGILWASLGQRPDVMESLAHLAESIGRDVSNFKTVLQRRQAIREAIGSRRMLLIIDDAWDLEAARQLLCGGHNCCHLLTTRIQPIAEDFAGAAQSFRISELDKDSGYQLLNQLAPKICAADPVGIQDLVKAVGGLPLALVLLGGYLSAPARHYFKDVGEDPLDELEDARLRLRLAQQRLGSIDDQALTLQQIIELSLEDLALPMVQKYCNLGVFAAKPAWFSRQAAEAIAECHADELRIFIDRNLLEIGIEEQLTLHQVLADFARSRIHAEMNQRHRDYYLAIVDQDREDWQRIEPIYDQIRWAWHCLVKNTPEDETLYAFLRSLVVYHQRRGLWDDCLEWSEIALQLSQKREQSSSISNILFIQAGIYHRLGNRIQALDLYKESLKIYQNLGDYAGAALAFNGIGNAYQVMNNLEEALINYKYALVANRQVDNPTTEASILNNLGQLSAQREDYEEAIDYFEKSGELYARNGDDGQVSTLINMAGVFIELKNYDQARQNLQQALSIVQITGDRIGEAFIYQNLGSLAFREEDLIQAAKDYQQSLAINRDIKNRPAEGGNLFSLASIYREQGLQEDNMQCLLKALDLFHEALNAQDEVFDHFGKLQSLTFIGTLHEQVENYETARDYYYQSFELATNLYSQRDMAATLKKIADVSFKMGQLDQAEEYYLKSLAVIEEHGTLDDERGIRISLANVYRNAGEPTLAVAQMNRAVEIDRMLSHPELLADLEASKLLE